MAFTCAHHFESVRHVQDVRLAARPAAVGIQIDGAPLIDETPAHHVRLLAVAAGGEPFGMARRRAGLADLVHVRHAAQYRLRLRRSGPPGSCCRRATPAPRAGSRESTAPPRRHAPRRRPASWSSPRRPRTASWRPAGWSARRPSAPGSRVTVVRVAGASTATCFDDSRRRGARSMARRTRDRAARPTDAATASARPPCAGGRTSASPPETPFGHRETGGVRVHASAQAGTPRRAARAPIARSPAAITIWLPAARQSASAAAASVA